jgi:hypothetical protein
MGIFRPSGVSFSGPICSSSAANVFSSVALTWISCVTISDILSRLNAVETIFSSLRAYIRDWSRVRYFASARSLMRPN